jgi:hypothetical protein
MHIPDRISDSLETNFWVKILKFFDANPDPAIFATRDPGSEMENIRIRDKHPGSATLRGTVHYPSLRLPIVYVRKKT